MSISLDRANINLNTPTTVVVTGVGTSWTAGTPGVPLFTLSGVAGAMITSQQVLSPTSATVTIAGIPNTGKLTLTDPLSGSTAILGVKRASAMKWFPGLSGN
ncbi:hypothetical protein [Singulisphaera sp. PoT]|uniref:hypothetical protein n=1 Tax=Singulisphaera sp. PoT TaxID=3411797 RepID=UPI003BF5DDD7